MDPLWSEIVRGLFRSREVKTLMGLTARLSWVLGLIIVAIIASAPKDGPLSSDRIGLLVAFGLGLGILFFMAYALGMMWPDRFHYGAGELLELERMRMGDSLSGDVKQEAEKKEK